jgi:hypothetical protein
MNLIPRLYVLLCFIGVVGVLPRAAHAQADQFPPVPIAEIQGAGLTSPLYQEWVDAVGVVTGLTDSGFYLQDPVGDGDPQTSDGIFVYTQRAPTVTVGECVRLRGAFVDEYYEKTELSRTKSIEPSDACPTADIAPVDIPTARLLQSPAELFEATEGMVVRVDDLVGVVQGPTKRFSNGEAEIAFLPEQWAPFVDGGRVFQWQAHAMPALMFVTNGFGAELPELDWGDRVSIGGAPGAEDAVVGVLDYNFGKYQLIPLANARIEGFPQEDTAAAPAPEVTVPTPAETGDFTVCTFNLLGMGSGTAQNPDPDDYAGQLYKRARAVAESLQGCTVIGAQEAGTPEDAQNLADLLATEFGLEYTATAIEGPGTDSFEFPLTNSVLTRDDSVRVLGAELRQGCSKYNYDVRFIPGTCPRGTYGLFNRPPLMVDMEVQGPWGEPVRLTVIDNHWKSKGGDESVNVVRRTDQALHVATLVQEKLDADPDAAVVVLGDLNDYYASGPVEALRTGVNPPMVHTFDALRPLNRYTYIFNGGSQVLDHVLVTPALAENVAEVRPIRINADFAYPATLNDTVHHSSDHDPVLVRIRPDGGAWLAGDLGHPDIRVELVDADDAPIATVVTDANGEFRIWNLTPGPGRVKLSTEIGYTIAPTDIPVELVAGANTLAAPTIEHPVVRQGIDAVLHALVCLTAGSCPN